MNNETKQSLFLYSGIFILTASILCLEVLASRVASIIFIHHYAFMVVSLAVLGLGCGGILVFYRSDPGSENDAFETMSKGGILLAVTVTLFLLGVTLLPVLTSQTAFFIALLLPFTAGGVVLSTAFRSFAGRNFLLYAADLSGAAVGSLLSLAVLAVIGGVNGILLIAASAGSAAVIFALAGNRKQLPGISAGTTAAIILLLVINTATGFLGEVPIRSHRYKDMKTFIDDPTTDAVILENRWSTFGRTNLIEDRKNDTIRALYVDGAAGSPMYCFNGDINNLQPHVQLLRDKFSAAHALDVMENNEKRSMLVIGPGGGRELVLALLAGVGSITGVEINPDFVDIVRDYSDYNGGIYTDYPSINIVVDEGRSYLRGSGKTYDIIMFSLPSTDTMRGFEGYTFAENYLLTRDAIEDYIDHLSPDGRLIMVLHNTYELVRCVSLVLGAFEERGIGNADAMQHIAAFGQKHDPAVIVSKQSFNSEEINKLYKRITEYKLDYPSSTYMPNIPQQIKEIRYPNGRVEKVTIFNYAFVDIAKGRLNLEGLINTMQSDRYIPTDNRPFFFKHERGLPVQITALLVIIILVNILFIIATLLTRRQMRRFGKPLLLFTLLGLGFMLVEISFLQRLTLYLGSTTVSLSILLAGLLAGMGLGSRFGGSLLGNRHTSRIQLFSLLIIIISLILFWGLPALLDNFMGSSVFVRALLALVFLIPFGFVLGVPFPSALRLVHERKGHRAIPWLYGINGTMSVLGSVGAVALSLSYGFPAALFAGVFVLCCYHITETVMQSFICNKYALSPNYSQK